MPITRRARTARIGVSQPKQTRAKDVGALFVCGCPLARQRMLCTRKAGQTIFANPDTGKSAVVLTSRIGKWAADIQGRKKIAEILTA